MIYQLKSKTINNTKIQFHNNRTKNVFGFLPIPKINEKSYKNFNFLDSFL